MVALAIAKNILHSTGQKATFIWFTDTEKTIILWHIVTI